MQTFDEPVAATHGRSSIGRAVAGFSDQLVPLSREVETSMFARVNETTYALYLPAAFFAVATATSVSPPPGSRPDSGPTESEPADTSLGEGVEAYCNPLSPEVQASVPPPSPFSDAPKNRPPGLTAIAGSAAP